MIKNAAKSSIRSRDKIKEQVELLRQAKDPECDTIQNRLFPIRKIDTQR